MPKNSRLAHTPLSMYLHMILVRRVAYESCTASLQHLLYTFLNGLNSPEYGVVGRRPGEGGGGEATPERKTPAALIRAHDPRRRVPLAPICWLSTTLATVLCSVGIVPGVLDCSGSLIFVYSSLATNAPCGSCTSRSTTFGQYCGIHTPCGRVQAHVSTGSLLEDVLLQHSEALKEWFDWYVVT